VKSAVGAGFSGGGGGGGSAGGATVMARVFVLLWPSASSTVRLTENSPAAPYVYEAVAVVASGVSSPLNSQLHFVTPTSSLLLLTKLQAVPAVHEGRSNSATGGALIRSVVVPSLQPKASTRVPTIPASRPTDRIESLKRKRVHV
jgi:hypothetical protein